MKTYIDDVKGKKATTYKVRVRVKKNNHCRNFKTLKEAERYKRQVEEQLQVYKPLNKKLHQTCGDLISYAINDASNSEIMKGSKASNLRMILDYDIAQIPVNELRGKDLTEHCLQRASNLSNPSPATLYQDVNNIIVALKLADEVYDIPDVIDRLSRGRKNLQKKGIIGSSKPRDRRPTSEELEQILESAAAKQGSPRTKLPIHDVINLALETAMRRNEIVQITWGDFQPEQNILTIRDRKDPKNPVDHDIWLSPEAIEIIECQPKGMLDDPIFPFSACSITASWGRICKQLKISELRFHDLRAEAACRYYLQDWNIIRIAKQTGHKDLNTLNNFYLRIGVIEHSLLDPTKTTIKG